MGFLSTSIFGDLKVIEDTTLLGNLSIDGNTTINNGIVTLSNYTGSTPSLNCGIEVERGTLTNAIMVWDESSDKWKVGLAGSETEISLLGHTHAASTITEDTSHKFVTDTQISTWDAKASTTVVTTSVNGLMSSTDKSKLDGIAANANNYTHPSTHAPSIISQDANNRFVTDTEKNTWNSKASTAVATTSANGLMSSTDKSKLDGIAANANNYTHPANHPPSIITQDASNRFVTDTEKNTWNAKQNALGYTPFNSAGGTISGDVTVQYPQKLDCRHINGSNAGDLYLNYHNPAQHVYIYSQSTSGEALHTGNAIANGFRKTYINTTGPTGGSDGEIWIQYIP